MGAQLPLDALLPYWSLESESSDSVLLLLEPVPSSLPLVSESSVVPAATAASSALLPFLPLPFFLDLRFFLGFATEFTLAFFGLGQSEEI